MKTSLVSWFGPRWIAVVVAVAWLGAISSVWGQDQARDRLPPGFPPPSTPEQSLRSMQLADPELRIDLVASEPHLDDPIALAWNEKGDLFVVEMTDYPLGPPGGRVRLLRDTDGDGRVDRATVFAEGLPYPTSVYPWKDGIFVLAAPYLWFLRDTDSDGRGDQRQVIFRGFGEGNPQHLANGLIGGLDGWIYGANGDSDGMIVGPSTPSEGISLRRRDFAFDPITLQFRTILGHSQYGHSFDVYGNRFTCNNSDHIQYVVFYPDALQDHPYVEVPQLQISIARHGGKGRIYPATGVTVRFNDPLDVGRFSAACSIHLYYGNALATSYWGNAFCCDAASSIVHRDVLRWEQGRPVAERAEGEQHREFLAAADPWVRPVYLATGPDGALYVVDMYRAVIEHPEWIPDSMEAGLDLKAGTGRGRLYRIAQKDHPPRAWPRLERTLLALTAGLISSNQWTQETAQRLLLEEAQRLGREQVQNALRQTFQEAWKTPRDASPWAEVAALRIAWTLARLGTSPKEEVHLLLKASNPRIRVAALRLARHVPDAQYRAAVLEALRDADPQVRQEAVTTLRHLPGGQPSQVVSALAERLVEDAELWPLRVTALAATRALEREVLGAVLNQIARTPPDAIPPASRYVVRELARFVLRSRPDSTLDEFLASAAQLQDVWLLAILAGASEAVSATEDRGTIPAERLMPRHHEPLKQKLWDLALEESQPVELRVDALRALRLWGPVAGRNAVSRLLGPDQPAAVRAAAVELVASGQDEAGLQALLERWPAETPTVRHAIVRVALASAPGRAALLHAARRGWIPARELLVVWPDARAQLADLVSSGNRQEVVRRYETVLQLPSDRERGAKLFEKHCQQCHTVQGVGNRVGPELVGVRKRDPRALLQDILDPNAAVDPRYVSHVVVTKDGRLYSGIIEAETGQAITLVTSENQRYTLAYEDIEELRSTGASLMPEGLEADLTPQDLADLLRYLRELQ
jgi:putative membrane-bound dehydrogenase-like protein